MPRGVPVWFTIHGRWVTGVRNRRTLQIGASPADKCAVNTTHHSRSFKATGLAALAGLLLLAGCGSKVQVGGDDGVGYRGKLLKDGKIVSVETTAGENE